MVGLNVLLGYYTRDAKQRVDNDNIYTAIYTHLCFRFGTRNTIRVVFLIAMEMACVLYRFFSTRVSFFGFTQFFGKHTRIFERRSELKFVIFRL
jgi:hypothetical protein